MELFGYKIEKQLGSSSQKSSSSFVPPDSLDGSTVINGGGINAFFRLI